ncbi:MAG: chemotaxis protein CheX [Lachnospiraceae bacterium]|nr:chemotaxis protein CheX [Lachnospiraceae bacterium]
MFGVYFGKYLVGKGVLTKEQYNKILSDNEHARVKLGLLAVETGVMTPEQAEEVNQLQQIQDKRFGDIAVEKGYLTDDQVGALLKKQGDVYLLFVQALVENEILSLDEIQQELNAYKQAEGLSSSDLDAIKSGDIDQIVPVFVKEDSVSPRVKEYIALVARNMVRFIDRHFRLEKVETINEYTASFVAAQELDGDYRVFSGFCGEGQGIKYIAEAFAKEEFDTVDLDVLDAACEFLNCNNGLYASKLSNEDVDLDMLPPIMKETATTIRSDENLFKVPLYIKDSEVDLIICMGSKYSLD